MSHPQLALYTIYLEISHPHMLAMERAAPLGTFVTVFFPESYDTPSTHQKLSHTPGVSEFIFSMARTDLPLHRNLHKVSSSSCLMKTLSLNGCSRINGNLHNDDTSSKLLKGPVSGSIGLIDIAFILYICSMKGSKDMMVFLVLVKARKRGLI